jgi:hypothetical protein
MKRGETRAPVFAPSRFMVSEWCFIGETVCIGGPCSCCLLDVFPDGPFESFIERDAGSLGAVNQMLRPTFWHFDCGPEFAIRPQIDDLYVFFTACGCLHSHRRRVIVQR